MDYERGNLGLHRRYASRYDSFLGKSRRGALFFPPFLFLIAVVFDYPFRSSVN